MSALGLLSLAQAPLIDLLRHASRIELSFYLCRAFVERSLCRRACSSGKGRDHECSHDFEGACDLCHYYIPTDLCRSRVVVRPRVRSLHDQGRVK